MVIASAKGQFGPHKPAVKPSLIGAFKKPAREHLDGVAEDSAAAVAEGALWTVPPADSAAVPVDESPEKIESSEDALKAMSALLSRCNGRDIPRSRWNAPQLTSLSNWTSSGAQSTLNRLPLAEPDRQPASLCSLSSVEAEIGQCSAPSASYSSSELA